MFEKLKGAVCDTVAPITIQYRGQINAVYIMHKVDVPF